MTCEAMRPVSSSLRIVTALALCAFASMATGAERSEPFTADKVAEGVLLFRPSSDRPGRVNSLVVERDDGLLVVGAQPSPEAARELLGAIGSRFSKPVRYLVLPHSHVEGAGGATAFADSVLVVASRACREALADPQYDFGAEARVRAADPAAWTEPNRPAPVLVLDARTTLADSRNAVELLPFGHIHSAGDLVTSLPDHDVFFIGALTWPGGSPYGEDARIGSWMAALNHLVRQGPRVIVPLRGPAIGVTELVEQRDALAWLRGQVGSGLSDRLAHEEIRELILDDPATAERFATNSPFLAPFLDQAIRQAAADRTKLRGQ
jgi:glyoxylase-like metal-dependent hydrolase (beta-lactamase superfamily II)